MKRYLLESSLIIVSVLLSLSIDSYLEKKSRLNQKNVILKELKESILIDKSQLKEVIDVQKKCFNSAGILINDFNNKLKLSQEELVKNFSSLKQNGIVSFFPQMGPFLRLLNTGSMELISSDDLRSKLLIIYDNLNRRKEFGDRVMDDFGMDFGRDLSPFIVVTERKVDKKNLIYLIPERKIENFTISKNYYRSELVLFYYSEYRIWIESFISMYKNYQELLDVTIRLIDLEISLN
jgi:hypothetical protein